MKQIFFSIVCLLAMSCNNACMKQPDYQTNNFEQFVQPRSVETELTANDGLANDQFGNSIAANGTFTAIGAPSARWKIPNTFNPIQYINKAGGVYIFNSSNQQLVKFVPNDVQIIDYAGNALHFDGNKLLVGVYGDNSFNADGSVRTDRGSAYLFDGNNGWNQLFKLEPTDSANAYAYFGTSVHLKNNIATVGANKAKIGTNNAQGSVYVFNATTGAQIKKIVASDGGANHYFGTSLAQVDNFLFVGAMGRINNKGAVYVYDANNNYAQTQILTANVPTVGAWFGASIAVEGDWLVVGSPSMDSYKGALYLFNKEDSTWSFVKKISASDAAPNDRLGTSVSINNGVIVAGAPQVNTLHGVAYTFEKDLGGINNWGQASKIIPSNGVTGDQFGYSVLKYNNSIFVGARQRNIGKGSVYVYQ